MQIFTGLDIIHLERFRSLANFERVAAFILSPREQELMRQSRDQKQFLASRFAAKEAIIKALPEPTTLADLEILNIDSKPTAILKNPTLSQYQISVSLTHSGDLAAATAVVILS